MKAIENTLTIEEIMKIMKPIIRKCTSGKDDEQIRRERVRRAKADFCNLDATDYCKFIEG